MHGFRKEVPGNWKTKLCGVYILHHLPSGKLYVGSTADLYGRHNDHLGNLRLGVHPVKELQHLYRESGGLDSVLQFESIITEDRDEAYACEQRILDDLKDSGLLLNKAIDAKSPNKGRQHSNSHKQAIAESLRGREHSPERKEKIARINAARGRRVSVDGVIYATLSTAARVLGMDKGVVHKRVNNQNPAYASWAYVEG